MKSRRVLLLSGSILLLVAGLASCSGDESEAEITRAAAKGPDEAIVRMAQGLADGRLEVAWQALPPSYRTDVQELVQLAATKMDAEVWSRSFGLVQKLTRLAREKRDYILEQPMLAQSGGDKKEMEAGWDAVVGILDTLANSELSDLKKLERLDVAEFLAGTGGKLMKQFASAAALAPDDSFTEQMSRLRRTKATVVSESGKTAVVRVEPPGAPATEETYVRVEGHWIPKKLADSWSTEIAEVRQQIEQMSTEYMAQNKQSVLMQLSMVEAALDQLLQTESREEFNAALGPIMGMAMGAMMAQAAASANTEIAQVTESPFEDLGNDPAVAFPEHLMAEAVDQVQTALPVTRPARQADGVETGSHEMYKPGEVPFDRAHLYVGQYLRVNTNSGVNMVSRLKEARTDALLFERSIYGGTASFEVTSKEIESLRLADR